MSTPIPPATEESSWDLARAFRQTVGFVRFERVGDAAKYAAHEPARAAVLRTFAQPVAAPDPAALRAAAAAEGMTFDAFVEARLPSALYGVRSLLEAPILPLGDGFAYVDPARLVFAAGHYCVSHSKVEGYAKEFRLGAAAPASIVSTEEGGHCGIHQGHHRAAAAYLSGADYVKVHIAGKRLAKSRSPRSPFRTDAFVPLRYLLLLDRPWEEEVSSV